MKNYFSIPTQVLFLEKYAEENEWCAGIAFYDKVICGCCGSFIDLSKLDKIKELEWEDISEVIAGDEILD